MNTAHHHGGHDVGRRPRTSVLLRLLMVSAVVASLFVSVTGCTHTKAKTMPDAPPLEMPPPPPRDVEPNESEPPQPVPLPQEPARNAPARPRPSTPANREPCPNETPKVEPPKNEAPIEAPKPTEEPKSPVLQTTPTQAEGEFERSIRVTLTKASNDLNRVDYRVLNTEARTQYDTAKSFIRQADAAVRSKNLVFAKSLADKAAALAAQLGGK